MKAPLAITLLFASCLTGAWSWFHVGVKPPERYLVLRARTEIPGFEFIPEPISEKAIEILATTNLINGTFTRINNPSCSTSHAVALSEGRFRVFMANWKASDSRQLDVVSHTPDICWAGAGWVSYDAGQPPLVDIDLPGGRMTFECRAFKGPNGTQRELVMWSTLVNGQVMEDGGRFRTLTDESLPLKERMAGPSRRRAANLFARAITDRIPASGDKQFVRFSVALSADWQPVFENLRSTAAQWLTLSGNKR